MATRVTMPMLGLTMEEGTVAEWLKQEGDAVQKDEPLLTVEMDKGTQEVPSPAAGVLRRIVVQAGTTVPVKTLIAEIGEASEVLSPLAAPSPPTGAATARASNPPPGAYPPPGAAAPAAGGPGDLPSRPPSDSELAAVSAPGVPAPATGAAASPSGAPPAAGGPGDLPSRPPSASELAAVSAPGVPDPATGAAASPSGAPPAAGGPGDLPSRPPSDSELAAVSAASPAVSAASPARSAASAGASALAATPADAPNRSGSDAPSAPRSAPAAGSADAGRLFASPRARMRARVLGIELSGLGPGSGPQGRIVEADVLAAGAAETRVIATPLARRLAQEHGVSIGDVPGTGPGGRITQEDVLLAAGAAAPSAAGAVGAEAAAAGANGAAGAAAGAVGAAAGSEAAAAGAEAATALKDSDAEVHPGRGIQPLPGEVRPLTRVRRITAERMAASAQATASVTLFIEVDFSEAARFRAQLQPEFARLGVPKLPWDALIARAAALALLEHPAVVAQWANGQGLRQPEGVDIGVAVALEPEGLVVPVLQQAGTRSLRELAADLLALVDRARAGRLSPSEMQGGTFTITNLGAYRIDGFTPIVNPPETAILGVGRIAPKPVAIEGKVEVRTLCTLSLSFDHRVVDGATAAAFLARLAELLERPYTLLGI